MSRRAVLSLCCAAAFAVATSAHASSIWDRVVDPTLADRDYAHKFAVEKEQEAELLEHEADLVSMQSSTGDETFARSRAVLPREAARAVLERFGAATGPDVRLRFDYGHILARLQQHAQARAVLLGAIAMAPTDWRASSAWFDIAICDAKLGARDDEAKAYASALALEDDPVQRALLFGNLAESRMSLGDLDGARDAAERSLQLHPLDLVRYTYGVILDRAGDEWGALEQVKLALAADKNFGTLHDPGVFFEPDYEIHFYQGLGWLALARALPPKTTDWELDLLSALREFALYSSKAAPGDRWVKRADEHTARIELTLKLKSPKDFAEAMKTK